MGSFNGNHTTPLGEYYDPTLGAFVTYDPSTVQPDAVAYFAKRAPAVICDRCGTTPAPHRLTNFGTRQRLQLCAACAAGPDWDDTPDDAPGGDDDDTGPYEITGRRTPAECATVTGWLTGWRDARTPDERINADIPVLDEGRHAHGAGHCDAAPAAPASVGAPPITADQPCDVCRATPTEPVWLGRWPAYVVALCAAHRLEVA